MKISTLENIYDFNQHVYVLKNRKKHIRDPTNLINTELKSPSFHFAQAIFIAFS